MSNFLGLSQNAWRGINQLGLVLAAIHRPGGAMNIIPLQQAFLQQEEYERRRRDEEKAQQVMQAAGRELTPGHLGQSVNPLMGRPTPQVQNNPANSPMMSVARILMQSPTTAAAGLQMLLKANEPPPEYNLGPNERRFRGTSEIASNIVDPPPARGVVIGNRIVNAVDGTVIKEFPADKEKEPAPPSGYRKTETGLEPIPGGPADIGQKGSPQKYRDFKASSGTFSGLLDTFEKQVDKYGGEMLPTEAAGKMDATYAAILLELKGMAQTGALDQGSIDVIQGMLKKPTGFFGGMTPKPYVKSQIGAVREYLKTKKIEMDSAYKGATSSDDATIETPSGTGGRNYVGFSENGRRVYEENGQMFEE